MWELTHIYGDIQKLHQPDLPFEDSSLSEAIEMLLKDLGEFANLAIYL